MATKKMFTIHTDKGAVEVEQMATFTRYVRGAQFRFVVTAQSKTNGYCVTHRLSGFRVCAIPYMAMLGASKVTWKEAGEVALDALIKEHGEQRVFDILDRAEKEGYGLLAGKSATA